jgi:hypothetical protein
VSFLTLEAAALAVGEPSGGQRILAIMTELGPDGVPGHRRLAREMAAGLAPERCAKPHRECGPSGPRERSGQLSGTATRQKICMTRFSHNHTVREIGETRT